MAGTVVADTLQADSTSTLVLKNGVANTPPTIQDSAGTQIGTFCRAWVNFNGTTVTNPASMTGVRASFNVSSILDNGTGDYTVNFTTAMPDINYAVVANTRTNGVVMFPADISSGSSVNIQTKISSTLALTDYSTVNVAIFR
jgi:hypothetical protein